MKRLFLLVLILSQTTFGAQPHPVEPQLPANKDEPDFSLTELPLLTVLPDPGVTPTLLYRHEFALNQVIEFVNKFNPNEWDKLVQARKRAGAGLSRNLRARVQRMDAMISTMLFTWRKNVMSGDGALKGDQLKKFDELLKNHVARKYELERMAKEGPSPLSVLVEEEQKKLVESDPLLVKDPEAPLPEKFPAALASFKVRLQSLGQGAAVASDGQLTPDLFTQRFEIDPWLDHVEGLASGGKAVDIQELRDSYQKINTRMGLGSLGETRARLYSP